MLRTRRKFDDGGGDLNLLREQGVGCFSGSELAYVVPTPGPKSPRVVQRKPAIAAKLDVDRVGLTKGRSIYELR